MRAPRFRRERDGRLTVTLTDGEVVTAPVPMAELDAAAAAAISRGVPPTPSRMTLAMDSNALEGPEVDEALGVAEPDVDRWETGELVPTVEQVRRLATLTGYAVGWLYGPTLPPMSGIICVRSGPGRGCHPFTSPAPRPPSSTPAPSPRRAPAPAGQGSLFD